MGKDKQAVCLTKTNKEKLGLQPVEQVRSANWLYRSLLHLTRPMFKLFFGFKVRVQPGFEKLSGPCLLMANHLSYLDVFATAYAASWRSINFVAGRALFEKPVLGGLLRAVQAIPKEQFYPDPGAIADMLRLLRRDAACVVFPEGQRSYTGAPLDFSQGSAKLIKKLAIPVYVIKIKGAGLAWPRWADRIRPGRIEAEISYFMTPDQVAQLSLAEIDQKLKEALAHNEFEWQKSLTKPHRYRSRKLAEGLERILYHCPSCQSDQGFSTRGRKMTCLACQAEYQVQADYSFRQKELACPEDPDQWSKLQLERMRLRSKKGQALYQSKLSFTTIDLASREFVGQGRADLVVDQGGIKLLPANGGPEVKLKISSDGNAYVSLGSFVQVFGNDGLAYRLDPDSPAEVGKIMEAIKILAEAAN